MILQKPILRKLRKKNQRPNQNRNKNGFAPNDGHSHTMRKKELEVVRMQKLVITGGIPLEGTVTLQGAKNSVLPILAAYCSNWLLLLLLWLQRLFTRLYDYERKESEGNSRGYDRAIE